MERQFAIYDFGECVRKLVAKVPLRALNQGPSGHHADQLVGQFIFQSVGIRVQRHMMPPSVGMILLNSL